MIDPLPLVSGEPTVRELEVPGARGRLWVVDDGGSGALYGGNKVRKLAWILAEAQRDAATDLLVFGAQGSHFVLATARYAATFGLRTHVLQFHQPDTDHVRAVAAETARTAASVTRLDHVSGLARALQQVVGIRRRTGRWPRWLSLGGSSGLGTVGWLLAGRQLSQRVQQGELPAPDRVFVALGSGGTLAGLAGAGLPGLVGVRVTPRWLVTGARVRRLAREAQRLAGVEAPVRFEIEHDWYCGGYGRSDERIEGAVELGHSLGLPLEHTYTGKAFAACLAHVRTREDRVWFVQTSSRTL